MTMRTQTAVILAAGAGRRLGHRDPKGFIQIDGESLIGRSTRLLREAGILRLVVVAGFRSESYARFFEDSVDVEIVRNERYAQTNSFASLAEALPLVRGESFLLLESDLFYEAKALSCVASPVADNVILASGPTGAGDEVWLEVQAGRLRGLSKTPPPSHPRDTEFVGICQVSSALGESLGELYRASTLEERDRMAYETDGLARLSRDHDLRVQHVQDLQWGEIDDPSHLRRVREIVAPRVTRFESLRVGAMS